jgi:hypothetical protein
VRAVDEGAGQDAGAGGQRAQHRDQAEALGRAARIAIAVVTASASAKSQKPISGSWYQGVGWVSTCVATSRFRIR